MKTALLYFDHDHGTERLFFVDMDRTSISVHLRMETGPDASYAEEKDTPSQTTEATVACASLREFEGFCQALIVAMRGTPFKLQDPKKQPFNSMPHRELVLEGFGPGDPPEKLTCRLPEAIAKELIHTEYAKKCFGHLV